MVLSFVCFWFVTLFFNFNRFARIRRVCLDCFMVNLRNSDVRCVYAQAQVDRPITTVPTLSGPAPQVFLMFAKMR